MVCFRCEGKGHRARECPSKERYVRELESQEHQESGTDSL